MSLLRASIVFVVLSAMVGCAKAGRIAERGPAPPPQAQVGVAHVPDATAPVAVEAASVEALTVVRGVLEPVAADSNMTSCLPMLGARHGTAPISLHVDARKALYVFAKARGPIGLATGPGGQRCATGGANQWVRLVVPYEYDDVTIQIADVDVDGERRGQTSPFVVVVSEVDEEPALESDERAQPSASDLVVRWSVKPRACAPEIEHFKCMDAAIEISDAKGNVVKRVALAKPLVGQLGCWPQGTGVHCGGPSGATDITLEPAPDGSGNVTVLATSESDGYCPPPEDCKSRAVLTKLDVARGTRLVADPQGTWPPTPVATAK